VPGAQQVVEAYLSALNAHDPDAVAALVSEDFVNEHLAVRGQSLTGRAAYRQRLDGFLSSMQDLRYEIERAVQQADQVVVAYVMSARWVPPDGGEARPFRLRGAFWFDVRDGLIARRVDYRDSADFEQQVGLRPLVP
jgi:steroid delta-isomerase-like uncharacterized protein